MLFADADSLRISPREARSLIEQAEKRQKDAQNADKKAADRGLTLSGTKTHVKQRFLPLTPLLMVSDDLWSPVLPA